MSDAWMKRWTLAFLMVFLLSTSGDAEGIEPTVTIAIFPCTDVVSSFKRFHPLVAYLKEVTRIDCRVVSYRDDDSYERAMINRELDFVLQDPHIFMRFADRYGRHSILRTLTLDGQTSQAGVVIVKKGKGIHRLEELKGKAVMFGPRVSVTRWIAAKRLLSDSGIDIDRDLLEYTHGGCCEDVAFSVFLEAVDAGVVCDHFLGAHANKQLELGVDADQIAIIGTTRPVPTKVFAAAANVDPAVVTRINTALLQLDPRQESHRSILHQAEIGGFLEMDDNDRKSMNRLLETVTAR